MMENPDAKTAYEAARSDIANLLGFFECELDKEPAQVIWTHAEILRKIRRDLIETPSFMSGIEAKAIEESLEDTRM